MLTFVEKKDKESLILFIHGFIGGINTWIREDDNLSILNYLKNDKLITDHYDFAIFDYFTKITDLVKKGNSLISLILGAKSKFLKNISVDEIGQLLQSEIRFNCATYKNIILIAHSMGGLISKSYIINEIKNKRKSPVNMYISLAVPHRGSDFATFGKIILNNPQINDLRPLAHTINQMNDDWINLAPELPETLYFQGNYDQIVPKASAISIDSRNKEIIYTDDDHFSIVRPEREDDVVITAIKKYCISLIKRSHLENSKSISEISINKLTEKILLIPPEEETIVLKFIDDIYPSEVSLKSGLNKIIFNQGSIRIEWPYELTTSLINVQNLLNESENYERSNSLFHNVDESYITSFFDIATSSINYANKIITNAPIRVQFLLEGMRNYWGGHSSNSIHLVTLKNYLILCNFNMQRFLAYALSHNVTKERFFPKSFTKWFSDSSKEVKWVPRILGIDQNIFWADVSNVSGESFNNYFWGKKTDIVQAYQKFNHKAVLNGWFVNHLIPQVELLMTEISSKKLINYNEVIHINKIRDNDFKEYEDYTDEYFK